MLPKSYEISAYSNIYEFYIQYKILFLTKKDKKEEILYNVSSDIYILRILLL